MVLKNTKETWEKCGIKTVKHYKERENIIELWWKVSYFATQTKHSNICDIALKRIRKYCGKKKTLQKKKNKTIKHFLKVEQVPKAIELRKKKEYNRNDIMVREETSIAEKIIKLFV